MGIQHVVSGTDERCPEAWDGGTHHLIPKRDGGTADNPMFVQTCRYCGGTYRNGRMVPHVARGPWSGR